MLEPAHLLTFPKWNVARIRRCRRLPGINDEIEEAQPDAGDKNGGHRHKREQLARSIDAGSDDHTLIPAKEFFDPRQRDRIHIPGIAPDVGYLFHMAIVRSVEMVIHGRGEPQGGIASTAIKPRQFTVPQQFFQRIR